eukprot:1145601-Pelagomonas_calceolata.AAC.1
MAVLDVQFMKLSGWSCAASYNFITSHTAGKGKERVTCLLSNLARICQPNQFNLEEREERLCRRRKVSLLQLRKRRHIGSGEP